MGVLTWHVGIETRQFVGAMRKYNLFVISQCDYIKIMNCLMRREEHEACIWVLNWINISSNQFWES